MSGFVLIEVLEGLAALLLTLVSLTLLWQRRRIFYLYWALAWGCFALWMIAEIPVALAGPDAPPSIILSVARTALFSWHIVLWVAGVGQFMRRDRQSQAPWRPSGRDALRLAGMLAAAAAAACVLRAIVGDVAFTVLLIGVFVVVYMGSAAAFAVAAHRRGGVAALLLAAFTFLVALEAGHYLVVFGRQSPPGEMHDYLVFMAFIDLFLMCLLATGLIAVLLDDERRALSGALQRLKESEDRFRLMFQHGGVGMALLGGHGQILEANPALQRMLGFCEEELRGHCLAEFLHADELNRDSIRNKADSGQTPVPGPALASGYQDSSTELYEREKRYRHSSGRVVWARVLRVPVRDHQGALHYHVGVLVDITERREAERALAESEARHRMMFQASLDGLLVLSDDGAILDANPAMCGMLGCDRHSLLNRAVSDLAIDWPSLRRQLRAVLTRGGERFETTLRRVDGLRIDVEMSGAVVALPAEQGKGLAGPPTLNLSCRDVTERRRAEQALLRSEHERRDAQEHLREERDFIATVLNTADALIVVLDAEGHIIRWSGKCVRASGRTEEQVRGQSISAVVGVPWPINSQGGAVPWRTRAGEERWIVWRASTVQGGPGYVIAAGMDVTEQRHLEDQLRHSQRMEMLGTLVGGIAHDFNNHLTAIIGNLQLVMGSPDLGRRHSDVGMELAVLLRDAERAAQRCADMTQRLLRFSHARGGIDGAVQALPYASTPKVVTQVNVLAQEAVRLLQHVLPSTVRVQTDLQADAWPVRGDATGLHQVLMNLAVNARDAMPTGGTLYLATRNRHQRPDDSAAPADTPPGPYLELTVHDTGVGMTPEVLQRIFDPFFTTKSAGQGTGLGLAVVYGIVKSHGGWVRVSSEPGWGSQFHIFLPAEPGAEVVEVEATAPVLPGPPSREAVPPPESPRTVLVVDDEELIRNLARSVLERDGYKVVLAADGMQAVEAYRKHGDKVAAVLLDYTMPQMTGVQVFAALRELDPDVRVIFSTGYAADHDGDSLMASGAFGFVPKPYRPSQLLSTVRSAVAS